MLTSRSFQECSKGTYSLISLGCFKNLVDSERMAGLLRRDGYRFVDRPDEADFVVINTCGFLQSARNESLEAIEEMVRLKDRGVLQGVIVAGCLAQRDTVALLDRYPAIDQLVGVFSREEIAAAADRMIAGTSEQRMTFRTADHADMVPGQPPADIDRLRLTLGHVAFLKISEGCDRQCTFCSIPSMRGKYASKPIGAVLAEAEQLAADGARELVLVAQDSTYYGMDTDGRPRLADLLARLQSVDGIEWIRLMYLYPMHVTDDLIELVASGGKVLPYLDLPLQHINDEILRRMNRGVTRAQTEALVDRLRERIEGLILRTTMITGFPGETEEQFVRQRRFERLGVFAYSQEPGTPAARLEAHVPEAVRQARRDRLMSVEQETAFAWNQAQVGRRREVLIDRYIPHRKNAWIGRSYADAPEIDGVIYVTGRRLVSGQIVPCEIVAARDYDLIGVQVGEPR